MANFAQYGIESAEWSRHVKISPDDLFGNGLPADFGIRDLQEVLKVQNDANDARDLQAAHQLKIMGLENMATSENVEVPSRDGGKIPIRLFKSKWQDGRQLKPIYLFFHGGGFMFGSVAGEDTHCTQVVTELDMLAIHVCYRHTPLHKHPTQRNDVKDAYDWITQHAVEHGGDASQIIISGISAGGSLAAWLTLQECAVNSDKRHCIKGQILGIPWLVPLAIFPHDLLESREIGSHEQCKTAPVLPLSTLAYFEKLLEIENPKDDYLKLDSEALRRLEDLPKTAILVCGRDILRDEALLYSENLKRVRVPTHVYVYSGMPHGFRRYIELPSTKRWNKDVLDSIRWMTQDHDCHKGEWSLRVH